MTQEEIAYFSGLFDGEGCVGLRMGSQGWIQPNLEICMTDKEPILWVHKITGCGSFYKMTPNKLPNRRLGYKWSCTRGSDIETLLRESLPYLKVKNKEVVALLVYFSFRRIPKLAYGKRAHPKGEEIVVKIVASLKSRNIDSAYQEALDLVVYLRQAIYERDGR